jgi:uncharacterized membrane protein
MSARTRPLLTAFSALGLAAAAYALYVHYQLLADPGYFALCDVNATVSCQQVFQSPYGTVKGVPVAAGGAIWAALVLLLSWRGMRTAQSEGAARAAGYVFLLATLGLGAVCYFAYVSFVVLRSACPVCMTMYASVVGVFLASAPAIRTVARLTTGVDRDLRAAWRHRTLAITWVTASVALVLLFPREPGPDVPSATGSPASPATELSGDELAALRAWVDRQPREPATMPAGGERVRLIKFNDYQCPHCRQAWIRYQGIIARYETRYPGAFRYESRDLPLEAECGPGGMHTAACEAAVAVRLARERNRGPEVEAALFERQSPTMTRDDVKALLEEVAQVSGADFEARYDELLDEVRADVRFAQELHVTVTPTFFLNGIRTVQSLVPAAFDAVIAYELERAGR